MKDTITYSITSELLIAQLPLPPLNPNITIERLPLNPESMLVFTISASCICIANMAIIAIQGHVYSQIHPICYCYLVRASKPIRSHNAGVTFHHDAHIIDTFGGCISKASMS